MDSRNAHLVKQHLVFDSVRGLDLASRRAVMKQMHTMLLEERAPVVTQTHDGRKRLNSDAFIPKLGMTCGDFAIFKILDDNQYKVDGR